MPDNVVDCLVHPFVSDDLARAGWAEVIRGVEDGQGILMGDGGVEELGHPAEDVKRPTRLLAKRGLIEMEGLDPLLPELDLDFLQVSVAEFHRG